LRAEQHGDGSLTEGGQGLIIDALGQGEGLQARDGDARDDQRLAAEVPQQQRLLRHCFNPGAAAELAPELQCAAVDDQDGG